MTIKTTLAALLLSACTIPGLTTGSTFSAGSSPTPATSAAPAPDPVAAAPAPAAPAEAPPPRKPRMDDVFAINNAATLLGKITSGKETPAGGLREQTIRDQAMYCSQEVENLVSRELDRTSTLPLQNADASLANVTLADADARICQPLAKHADGWAALAKEAHKAENLAWLEPYRKAGVHGDKLQLVDDLGKQLIGPRQADPTPAVVAKANVLFSLRHDGFRDWTIVRYAFKGNAQIAVTEKGYADRPGPDQYR
jgi:hypothetical protein